MLTLSAVVAAGAVLTIIAAFRVAAAGPDGEPSSGKGYALAQKLCQGCHVIESSAETSTPVGVPTFRGIANRPGQTRERITNVLIQPHTPMPDIRLTNDEIENILAYLETLRTDPQIPPLFSPGRAKPDYPQPS
jgi:cytochrome c